MGLNLDTAYLPTATQNWWWKFQGSYWISRGAHDTFEFFGVPIYADDVWKADYFWAG